MLFQREYLEKLTAEGVNLNSICASAGKDREKALADLHIEHRGRSSISNGVAPFAVATHFVTFEVTSTLKNQRITMAPEKARSGKD